MKKRNLLNLKRFLLLEILAQFGCPLASYGVFREGLYMVLYAGNHLAAAALLSIIREMPRTSSAGMDSVVPSGTP